MAGDVYKDADRALGGFLPFGGTASPITKAVFPAQPFPGRSKELEKQTGVKGRFIDVQRTPTLYSRIAPVVAPKWGDSNYGNIFLGQVGMQGYQGGATPEERKVEYHELGHLNPKDRAPYSYFGGAGRALQGISDATGNLPPMDLAAGLAMRYADAEEEDRAERFTARFAKQGGYEAPYISPEGRSEYGDFLREEGQKLTSGAIERMKDPFGLRTRVESFVNTQRAKPLQEELSRSLPAYRKLLETNDEITPEMIKESERLGSLKEQIEALGIKSKF